MKTACWVESPKLKKMQKERSNENLLGRNFSVGDKIVTQAVNYKGLMKCCQNSTVPLTNWNPNLG